MRNPVGAIIEELRDANIASGRVRAGKAAPAAQGVEGDARAVGKFVRFVVISMLGTQRENRAPIAVHRIGYRAYGTTEQDAAALAGELSDVLHIAGPRISPAGVAIYQSREEVGSAAGQDPDTKQPYSSGVIVVHAGTEVWAGS